MNTIRGIVQNGTIVLPTSSSALDNGTEVVVTPVDRLQGSSRAILAALNSAPSVPSSWVDELESLIAAGRRPTSTQDPLAHDDEVR